MKINRVVVGFKCKHTLPEYNNIESSLWLDATLQEGENSQQACGALFQACKDFVHNEIDTIREKDGLDVKYFEGATYTVWVCHPLKYVLVLPSEADDPPEYFMRVRAVADEVRFRFAYDYAKRLEKEKGYVLQVVVHKLWGNGVVGDTFPILEDYVDYYNEALIAVNRCRGLKYHFLGLETGDFFGEDEDEDEDCPF